MNVIYQLPTSLPATVGTLPSFKFMVCGDGLAKLTTSGYLNEIDLQSNPISTTDILQVLYSFNPQNQTGLYGAFLVSIDNGIITLTAAAVPGEIILPVTTNDIAVWANSEGALKDIGISTDSLVVLTSPPSVANYIAKFSNTTGGITSATSAAINIGVIQSGINGVPGGFAAYPSSPNAGVFSFNAIPNAGNYAVNLQNSSFGQRCNVVIPDPGNVAGQLLIGATSNPFVSGNLPVASGTTGLMADSGIAASNLVISGSAPKLYVSQAASTAQSITTSVSTQITLDQVSIDTATGFSSSAYTAPLPGYYYINFQIILVLQSGDTGVLLTTGIYVNGNPTQYLYNTGSISNANNTLATGACGGVVQLSAGDVVTLWTEQVTAGARSITSGSGPGNTFLSIFYIS